MTETYKKIDENTLEKTTIIEVKKDDVQSQKAAKENEISMEQTIIDRYVSDLAKLDLILDKFK